MPVPSPLSGSPEEPVKPAKPDKPKEAAKASPGSMTAAQREANFQPPPPPPYKPIGEGASEEEKEKRCSWIEIEMVGEDDLPYAGEAYEITLPDGSVKSGTLDEKGFARVEDIEPGSCEVTFPDLDQEAWAPA